MRIYAIVLLGIAVFACDRTNKSGPANKSGSNGGVIREINQDEIARGTALYALVGADLIDGTGAALMTNSCVIIREGIIEAVGKNGEVNIPDEAEKIDLSGLTMLPGLIDAHYHDEDSDTLTTLFLMNGVTSVRDPGEWIESYDHLRKPGLSIPRLFLAGPHLDQYPPAYPKDAYIVRDVEEAGLAVDRHAAQGATVIKVYYGLSIGQIKKVCAVAHEHGLPVTAHLEITDARDAINAGLDGIEHITSFGLSLLPARAAEKYKQDVLADKNARRRGRYVAWSSFSMTDNKVDSLIAFVIDKETFVTPTLAVFERRSDRGDSIEVNGFRNMMEFVGRANDAGMRLVVGSHSYVPYAELGFAYQREMELMQEAGLSNMEVIMAATLDNAKFFRIADRLGSIEKGKIADLILVEGKPLEDITTMRNVRRVMLNGVWVK